MARKLSDWLKSYGEYTRETESASIFHRWVGVSVISSALARKTWFNFGRIKIYPNLYIVLVADPGVARKTQAISFGEGILSEIPGITIAPDAITPQALLDEVEASVKTAIMPDNTQMDHCSLSILSGEFESFLGQKKENNTMLVMLTDLYDCKAKPYRYKTKHSGSNTMPNPFLTLLSATTPESLASSLPSTAIGGGLTSRIIFVWAGSKEKKVCIPEDSPELRKLKDALIQDLAVIERITGSYNYSQESKDWWTNFYLNYDEQDINRICKDPAFGGWYSRKPTMMIKLSTIMAASIKNDRIVEAEDFVKALSFLEKAERTMGKAFTAVGRSDITSDVQIVKSIIEKHGKITEKKLMQMVWRDIDARKFENVSNTIVRSGEVRREYVGPVGNKEIMYFWVGC